MHIGHSEPPFSVRHKDGRLVIADDDYSWLQVAPKGGRWWLTAMLDPAGNMLQYYFDITGGNVLTDGPDAYFDDMFLDVVMHADGTILLLDADELDSACADGTISPEQKAKTRAAADELIRWLKQPEARSELKALYASLEKLQLKPWDELV